MFVESVVRLDTKDFVLFFQENSIVSLETAVKNRETNLLNEIEKAKSTSKKLEKEKSSTEAKLNAVRESLC